jgi:putative peptidoglycan lipid II flippase
VLWLMIPRVIGQGVTQINFIVNVALSSRMGDGPLSALTVAFTLMFTVLGILGQSVGTAVFPTLSMQAAQRDMDGYRRTLANALRAVLFTNIPAGIGLITLGMPLIATLFERGLWTTNSTLATAWALGLFAVGLPAFALQEVLARSFYALKDTFTPVAIGVAGVVLNVALSLLLIQVVRGSHPAQGAFGGLALANVVATCLESAAMWILLRRRVGSLHDAEVAGLSVRTFGAALAMGGVLIALEAAVRGVSPVIRLVAGGLLGVATFEGIALALRVPEARSVPATILRRFRR